MESKLYTKSILKKMISILLTGFILVCYNKKEISAENKKSLHGNFPAPKTAKTPAEFVPSGYRIFEKIYGDLNKDGKEDCVLIIKGTNKNNFVDDTYRGKLDRNRCGIIIAFNKGNYYELALKNYNCFSSENEDGGVYFPPELSVKIKENNLYIHYAHGRYGWWSYTFQHQNSDFELIAHDRVENRGPVVDKEIHINFVTKKRQTKMNVNENAEGGDEIFKETLENAAIGDYIKLSAIADFDDLYF